jgi:ankyrin repeat protein
MHILEREFIQACRNGNILKVKLLLKRSDINPSFDHNVSISVASDNGQTEVVKLLLKDPRVDPSDDYEYSTLLYASENNHIDVINLLLQDPRIIPDDDIIFYASRYGNIEIIKKCLQKRNENNYVNYINVDGLQDACIYGHTEIVKIFLEDNRVDPILLDKKINRVLCCACIYGRIEIVKLLLQDHRIKPIVDNDPAISSAATSGHIEIVKLLLQKQNESHIIYSNNQAIHYANANRHKEIVKLLKNTTLIRTFHKLNKIVCFERIKKWLLKKVVLRPNSIYVKRLVNEF